MSTTSTFEIAVEGISSLQMRQVFKTKPKKSIQPHKPCRKCYLSNAVLSTAHHPPFMQSVPIVVYNVVTCFHNKTSSHESSSFCPPQNYAKHPPECLKNGYLACKSVRKKQKYVPMWHKKFVKSFIIKIGKSPNKKCIMIEGRSSSIW